MNFLKTRERRRREISIVELDLMDIRYEKECGKVITRKATEQEKAKWDLAANREMAKEKKIHIEDHKS
jgi:hypothetical protein